MSPLLLALDVKIDQGVATIIVALIVAASSIWQSMKLSQVHTLVNSNFTEAKAARVAAEAALKTSQDLNLHLQQQLDAAQVKPVPASPVATKVEVINNPTSPLPVVDVTKAKS